MTAAILQTPLEVILFLSSLASHGVEQQSFQTISETLKKDQYIRDSEDFDETRLSPESLLQLYLTLLRDEVRNQDQQKGKPASPGPSEDGSPGSRKGKLSDLHLQSLSDTREYQHLLPVILNKQYTRYREDAIASIKADEEEYRSLQRQSIKGKQDGRTSHANGDAEKAPELFNSEQAQNAHQDSMAGQNGSLSTGSNAGKTPSGLTSSDAQPTVSGSPSATFAAPVSSQQPKKHTPRPADGSLDVSAGTTSASEPASSQASGSPSGTQQRPDGQVAHLPAPAQGSAASNQTTKPSGGIAGLPPGLAPAQNPGASAASTRPSQSPLIFQPPQGILRPSPSPSTPASAASQYGKPPGQASGKPPAAAQPFVKQPQFVAPRQAFPHRGVQADPRAVYGQQGSSFQPGHPQVIPHGAVASAVHQRPQMPIDQTGAGRAAQYPATPSAQFRVPGLITPSGPATQARRSLPPLDTSASSTRWKSSSRVREKSPERPPLSPLRMEFDESESEDEGPLRESRKSTGLASSRATPTDKEDTPSRHFAGRGRGRGRGGRPRGSGRAAGLGRGGSPSASNRTRSPSISSQAEGNVHDRRTGPRKVKQETGTPAEERPPSGSSNPSTPNPQFGRRRGNTLRANETPPLPRPSQKRKRADTLDAGSTSSAGPATPRLPTVPTRSGYVLAVRNLPRIAQTLLNDVTTHKLASMFQRPITEREAPGYRGLVYQPQDLKTIRSMLSAGGKMILNAENAAQEAGTSLQSGPSAGTVWLERSAEVIPPRAIVNSSQLETEICRIFANAVMFNPDPKRGVGPVFRARAKRAELERREKVGRVESDDDESEDEDANDDGGSLVEDAREMFYDVEKQLTGWRAAERTSSGEGTGGLELSKEESMAEESKDDEENAGTEGEERPARRRWL